MSVPTYKFAKLKLEEKRDVALLAEQEYGTAVAAERNRNGNVSLPTAVYSKSAPPSSGPQPVLREFGATSCIEAAIGRMIIFKSAPIILGPHDPEL